ncbi:g7748 [Coccomyxa viridis]|uniref:Cytochrome c-553 n=1 Tax=Coccomyxa viridis TaxID=1274662 RepID=A0ABP1G179_9CHLO
MTSPLAHADEDITGSFNKNCIGCHVGGGNVVQAGATLKEADLQKNGAASVEAIYDLVYNGKGKMPGYGAGCTPKGKCTFGPRLSDDEIQRLSHYVLQQAGSDWR